MKYKYYKSLKVNNLEVVEQCVYLLLQHMKEETIGEFGLFEIRLRKGDFSDGIDPCPMVASPKHVIEIKWGPDETP